MLHDAAFQGSCVSKQERVTAHPFSHTRPRIGSSSVAMRSEIGMNLSTVPRGRAHTRPRQRSDGLRIKRSFAARGNGLRDLNEPVSPYTIFKSWNELGSQSQLRAHPTSSALGATIGARAGDVGAAAATSGALSSTALLYMMLLAVQFGVQPALTRRFTSQKANRRGIVFIQELIKCSLSTFLLLSCGRQNIQRAVEGWTLKACLVVAGLPATLYAVQNVCSLMAYQNLDSVSYNVLNQTKTMSAALCCFLLLGKRQSPTQIVALFILLLSSLVTEGTIDFGRLRGGGHSRSTESAPAAAAPPDPKGGAKDRTVADDGGEIDLSADGAGEVDAKRRFTMGVVPIMLASFISGLAGALAQRSLQGVAGRIVGRNPHLFTAELSLCSAVVLAASIIGSKRDRRDIREKGFFYGWTPKTLIPITVNAAGGVLVGLVTKHAGSVRKGFALIAGLLLTGVFEAIAEKRNIPIEKYVGCILAMISIYLHSCGVGAFVR